MKRQSLMFDVGTAVKIAISRALLNDNLIFLAGQSGEITECRFQNMHSPGAFVMIKKGKNAGEEWFIPVQSLQSRESLNRMRSKNLLKDFKKL